MVKLHSSDMEAVINIVLNTKSRLWDTPQIQQRNKPVSPALRAEMWLADVDTEDE